MWPVTSTRRPRQNDGDGFTNLDEYLNGTDPRIPEGTLEIAAWQIEADSLAFEFQADAAQSYSILVTDNLAPGTWTRWQDITAEPTPRTIRVSTPMNGNGPTRFYRIVSPQLP